MKNELKQHKKSDGIRWVAITLAIILLATAVMAVMTKGFKDFNPYGWFDKPQEQPTSDNGAVDESGNDLTNGEVHKMPKSMTFRNATSFVANTAFSSVTITATVKPDNADNKLLDWAVVFINPDSAWATGKSVTDYVTVMPQADGSNIAIVECIEPFGEQIKVVVSSREFPDITAECTVDFSKRVKKTSYSYSIVDYRYRVVTAYGVQNIDISLPRHDFVGTLKHGVTDFIVTNEYTAYTIDNAEIDKQCGLMLRNSTAIFKEMGVTKNSSPVAQDGYFYFMDFIRSGFTTNINNTMLTINYTYLNKVTDWLKVPENANKAPFYFSAFGYKDYKPTSIKIPIFFSADALKIAVENIDLDNPSIIV